MPLVEHVVQKARLRIVVVPRIAAKAVFTQQLDKLLRPLTVRRCGRKLCRQPRCQQVELTQVMRNVEIGILRLRNQKRRLPEIQLRFRPTDDVRKQKQPKVARRWGCVHPLPLTRRRTFRLAIVHQDGRHHHHLAVALDHIASVV